MVRQKLIKFSHREFFDARCAGWELDHSSAHASRLSRTVEHGAALCERGSLPMLVMYPDGAVIFRVFGPEITYKDRRIASAQILLVQLDRGVRGRIHGLCNWLGCQTKPPIRTPRGFPRHGRNAKGAENVNQPVSHGIDLDPNSGPPIQKGRTPKSQSFLVLFFQKRTSFLCFSDALALLARLTQTPGWARFRPGSGLGCRPW
jgi:hypothetical protein